MMNKTNTPSPCLTCKRVADPCDCENKQCKLWSQWFLGRWEQIHGYFTTYYEKEAAHELETGSH